MALPNCVSETCDHCDKPATKVLNGDTSPYCGHHCWLDLCDECFALTEGEMKKQAEREHGLT